MNRLDGMVLLAKPPGITSFSALGSIKRALGSGKVGHTGTLDRFASGLLVALCGRCTRLVARMTGHDKIYRARFCFGKRTDTLDPEGEVVETGPVPDRGLVEANLPLFTGRIEQVPPQYSAVHQGGERAWRRARRGEETQLAPRAVEVRRFDLLAYEPPELDVEIHCSKGTYVRALARDLGAACGSCAYVVALERTRVGPYTLREAVPPEEFDPARDLVPPEAFVPELEGVCAVRVEEQIAGRVAHGIPLRPADLGLERGPAGREDGQTYALLSPEGRLTGLVRWDEGRLRYEMVFSGD